MILKSLFQSFSIIGLGAVGRTLMLAFRLLLVVWVISAILMAYRDANALTWETLPSFLFFLFFQLWLGFMEVFVSGLMSGYALLPLSILFSIFFSAKIAGAFAQKYYPIMAGHRPLKRRPVLGMAIWAGVMPVLLALAGTFITLFGGVVLGIAGFVFLNGRVLGKEAFRAVADRHHSPAETDAIYSIHSRKIHLYGAVAASLMFVPWLGLFAGVYAINMMTHFYQRLASQARQAKEGAIRTEGKLAQERAEAAREAELAGRDWEPGPWDQARI